MERLVDVVLLAGGLPAVPRRGVDLAAAFCVDGGLVGVVSAGGGAARRVIPRVTAGVTINRGSWTVPSTGAASLAVSNQRLARLQKIVLLALPLVGIPL